MEFVNEHSFSDRRKLTKANVGENTQPKNNSADKLVVKVETDELYPSELSGDTISINRNFEKQSQIKIEKVDELVCWDSTKSYDSKQDLEVTETKNELFTEEYHTPFKDEISEDIEKQDSGQTQHFMGQETTKKKLNLTPIKQNVLSTTSRILKFKQFCNQCRLCGRVSLYPPDYFLFHFLCYHSGAKFLKCNRLHHKDRNFDKSFKRKNAGKTHRFKCKTFLTLNKRRRHLPLDGKPSSCEKPFKCETCLKQFGHKHHLFRHVQCHTDEKPFECEVSLKQCSQKNDPICHMRSHTDKKQPLECAVCFKQFPHKSHFIRHIRCHTGEKPFECEICLKQFTQNDSLKRHMRSHNGEKPFECEICLKRFTQKSNLIIHVRCHTGEKPFKCEICLKRFSHSSHLNCHVRIHTGEKPFKCEI